MKLSKYNIEVKNKDFSLVYNNISGEVVVLSNNKYNDFINMKLSDCENDRLFNKHFYVDDDCDEYAYLLSRSKYSSYMSNTSKFRILTTTNCNAHCFYCYEQGIKSFTMKGETIESVISFIVKNSKYKKNVSIEWFGGEPLLNKDAIRKISKGVKQALNEDQYFYSTIVTNGSLIDENTMVEMKNDWSVRSVQITIDGVGKDYENVKRISGFSFSDIVSKIEGLVKNKIKVDIRLNFTEIPESCFAYCKNLKQIEDVIKYFSGVSFRNDINIYASKIFDFKQRDYFNLEHETIFVDELLHKYGFLVGEKLLPKIMKQPCQANNIDYFTINANGDVFKCDRKLLSDDRLGHASNYEHDFKKEFIRNRI